MATKAVSTWSLHRSLGSYVSGDRPGSDSRGDRGGDRTGAPEPAAGLALLDLPAELRRHGYDTVQICHFHLPSRDESYLGKLRAELAAHEVVLDALLIDDGDLTHPSDADAHQAWISGWVEVAAALGAHRARVVAGKHEPTPARLRESGRRLAELAASHPDVRIVTENWLALTPGPAETNAVLDAAGDRVGLLVDLGNWTGPDKYDRLAAIAHRAETCHAKCHFTAGGPDRDDFAESLDVLRRAGYTGPLALVYDGDDTDEWARLEEQHTIAAATFG